MSDTYGFARDSHKYFPPMVVVSIVNFCNLRCRHCFFSKFSKMPGYKKNEMSWQHWTRICDQISEQSKKNNLSILNLGTDGEPLLHSRFLDLLRYARQKNIYPINITTNGTLLTHKTANAIINEGLLDVINISIDAMTQKTYQRIRGGNLMHVINNVHRLLELRSDAEGSLPKIQVNIIDQPEARHEVEAFKKYWTPLVDQVMVRTYYDTTSFTGGTGPDLRGRQNMPKNVKRWPCQLFWRRLAVTESGIVQFCLDDWFHKSRIGHLDNNTIDEIWQGKQYGELRQHHLNRDFEKISYCSDCTEWQGMRWDYDYFLAMEKILGKKML